MHFKIVPAIGPRYWVGIMIASICGANMGDSIPDVLKLSDLGGLLMLELIFAVIALANQWSRRGNEALYWLAILVVRAAATNLADLGIHRTHLDYITVSAGLAALLVAILALRRALSLQPVTCGLPRTNGLYWLAMLTAGTLGTVLGDGIGHMIHPITVGVPISAIIATGAVALIFARKTRLDMASAGAASYWAAIVAIRTWGTNFGDIAAFFLSLPVSMMLSGLLLVSTLIVWREPSNPTIAAATWPASSAAPIITAPTAAIDASTSIEKGVLARATDIARRAIGIRPISIAIKKTQRSVAGKRSPNK
jgi:uncharacterized membrane-anchored protein